MLAAVSTVNPIITLPSPLVATTLPDATGTTRVAADNVAPSVSIPAIDVNAKGSSGTVVTVSTPPLSSEAASPPTLSSTFLINDGKNFWASPQATFLAQVISQDLSVESRSILVQYEKLLALPLVKYKPSDATLPEPEPSNLFGNILKNDSQPRAAQAQPPVITAQALSEKAPEFHAAENVQPVRPVTARPGKKAQAAAARSGSLQANIAYQRTVARNASLPKAQESSGASIEEIQPAV